MFPCLLTKDRHMTMDDSALKSAGVAYALAHSITLLTDRAILERVDTIELGLMSF